MTGVERLEQVKNAVREVGAAYQDRLDRSRRLYVEERAHALRENREIEYKIKQDTARFFCIDYTNVCFCGSAQLGFSVYQDRLFVPAESDLDIACVSGPLFQRAWMDVVASSRAFSDYTAFGNVSRATVDNFRDQIAKRGMIRISVMPKSKLSNHWRQHEDLMTRKNISKFSKISFAIYMSEYAFCWKQDSALTTLFGQ